MSEVRKLWGEALILLATRAPLHASILSQLDVKMVRGEIWPGATDGKREVYLCEDRLLEGANPWLPPDWGHDQRVAALAALAAHESEHVMRRFAARVDTLMNHKEAVGKIPDAEQRKRVLGLLFNLAQDFIINSSVIDGMGLPLPGEPLDWSSLLKRLGGQRTSRFGYLYDQSVAGRSEESLVLEMLSHYSADMSPEELEGVAEEVSLDGHCELGDAGQDNQKIMQRALQMAQRFGCKRGYVPKEFERLLEEGVEEVRLPWRTLLAQALQAALAGQPDWTTERPNRYLQVVGSQVLGFGEVRRGVRKLGFAIDTSASMSEEELKMAIGALRSLLRVAPPEEVVVLHCDAEVQHEDTVRFGAFNDKVLRRMYGGGGTAFDPAMRRFDDLGVDLVVYVTDGYGDDPTPPKAPVVWLLTSDTCSAAFGRKIHINA